MYSNISCRAKACIRKTIKTIGFKLRVQYVTAVSILFFPSQESYGFLTRQIILKKLDGCINIKDIGSFCWTLFLLPNGLINCIYFMLKQGKLFRAIDKYKINVDLNN
jgi:hypothetical protein